MLGDGLRWGKVNDIRFNISRHRSPPSLYPASLDCLLSLALLRPAEYEGRMEGNRGPYFARCGLGRKAAVSRLAPEDDRAGLGPTRAPGRILEPVHGPMMPEDRSPAVGDAR